jgi:DNA helicase-2/ATP-dependent DNA helicase PcrA
MKLLMRSDTCVYVVGDPDQTIYTWRGANQNIILNFTKEFPDAETIILDRNYRSTKTILDAANLLISKNKKRVPKNLYTLDGAGEAIDIKRLPNAEGEAKYVISQIMNAWRNKTTPPEYKNIAVLYRSLPMLLVLLKPSSPPMEFLIGSSGAYASINGWK